MGPDSGKDREIPKGPRSQGIWSSAGAWMRSECAGGEQREGAELGGGEACPLGVLSSSAPFLSVRLEPALFLAPGRWTYLQSRILINKLQWMSWCAHLFPFGSKHKAWAPSYIPPTSPPSPPSERPLQTSRCIAHPGPGRKQRLPTVLTPGWGQAGGLMRERCFLPQLWKSLQRLVLRPALLLLLLLLAWDLSWVGAALLPA